MGSKCILQYTLRLYNPPAVRQFCVPLMRMKLQNCTRTIAISRFWMKGGKQDENRNIKDKHSVNVLYSPNNRTDTYGKSFIAQNTTLENFEEIFRRIIYLLKPKDNEIIAIGDYGAASGGRTIKLLDKTIGTIKELHGRNRQVLIVYNDLPESNFNDLFQRLTDSTIGTTSYMNHWDGIFPVAVGNTFYEQIMPTNSMDIIFSCHALQYLSTVPCHFTKGLTLMDATPEEHNQFKDVADKDWENFLVHRARELKPGGFLIVAVPVLNNVCTEAMYNVRQNSSIWKGAWDSMLNNGVITEEEYVRANINFYLRNEDELLFPFNSNSFAVHGSGLELQTISIQPAVYLKYDEKYEDMFTRTEFEQRLCDGLFSVIHGNIWYALSETRTETNRMAVMDTFREEILRRLRESKIDSYQFPRADIVMRRTNTRHRQ